jgi:hypothetical protein
VKAGILLSWKTSEAETEEAEEEEAAAAAGHEEGSSTPGRGKAPSGAQTRYDSQERVWKSSDKSQAAAASKSKGKHNGKQVEGEHIPGLRKQYTKRKPGGPPKMPVEEEEAEENAEENEGEKGAGKAALSAAAALPRHYSCAGCSTAFPTTQASHGRLSQKVVIFIPTC